MPNPTNLIFLNSAAAIIAGFMCWIFFQDGITKSTIPQKSMWRIGSTLFVVIAFALPLGLALTIGFLGGPAGSYIAYAVPIIIVSNVLLLLFTASYRQVVDEVPLHWLIASNIVRIGPGIVFLGLLDMGLLPHDFAFTAGYGDVITGIASLAVAYLIAKRVRYAREIALVWCAFGLLDLINALYLGQTTIPGWVTMLAQQGQSVGYINWFLLIPAAPVPLFAVIHILLFRKLGLFRTRSVEPQAIRDTAS